MHDALWTHFCGIPAKMHAHYNHKKTSDKSTSRDTIQDNGSIFFESTLSSQRQDWGTITETYQLNTMWDPGLDTRTEIVDKVVTFK